MPPRQTKQSPIKKPLAPKANSKKKTKEVSDDVFIPEDSDHEDSEAAFDEMMEALKKPESKKRKSKVANFDIKEFELVEAKEVSIPKKQSLTKKSEAINNDRKVWTAAETTCLKLLVTGTTPLGRNCSG